MTYTTDSAEFIVVFVDCATVFEEDTDWMWN